MKKYEGHTPEPWYLVNGFSDWNMPKQHEIYLSAEPKDERDCVAVVPSKTPAPIGAPLADREYAKRQGANAALIADAPKLLRQRDKAVGLLRRAKEFVPHAPWGLPLLKDIDTFLSQLEAENDEGAKRE